MTIFYGILVLTIINIPISALICKIRIRHIKDTYSNSEDQRKKVFLILTSIPLTLLLGLRDLTVGTDTWLWGNTFHEISNSYGWGDFSNTRYEYGYFFYNKLIGIFTQNESVLLFITGMLTIFLFFKFIYSNSDNVYISVILFQTMYIYNNSFNASRQLLAISIAINGYSFLKRHDLRKSISYAIIGSFFHSSVLILLVLYVVIYLLKKITTRKMLSAITISIMLPFMASFLQLLIVQLFPKYSYYLNNTFNEFNSGRLMPLIYFLLVIIFSFYSKTPNDKSYEINVLGIFILSLAAFGLTARHIPMAQRFGLVVMPFYLLYVPAISNSFKNKQMKIFVYFGLVILSVVYHYSQLQSNNGGILPYTSILSYIN